MSNKKPDNNIHALLTKTAEGDPEAFRVIFKLYWDFVVANAKRFLKDEDAAHDVSQEVFIRLWIFRQKLADVLNFDGYLNRVLRNAIYDSLKEQIKNYVTIEDCSNILSEIKLHQQLEAKELEEQISEAIENLPEQMQRAFKLSRFENLTHEQISKVMNISKATSQNYIARAIIHIRKHLSQYARLLLLALSFFQKINFR